MISEAQARVIIDEQLKDSGWDPRNPNSVSLETTVDQYRFDYLLKDRNPFSKRKITLSIYKDYLKK